MNRDPKTPDEEMALHQAFQNGARYEIEVKATVIVLDEGEVRLDALKRLEESHSDSAEGLARVTDHVRSDTAEALGVLLSLDKLLNTEGAVFRAGSHRIRLIS